MSFLKQIFTWWHRQTLGTFIYTLIIGKFVGKMNLEINIIQILKEKKGGLFTRKELNLQKFLQNGTLGSIFKQKINQI